MNIFGFDIIADIIIIVILGFILYFLVKNKEQFEVVADQINAVQTWYPAEVNSSYFTNLLDAKGPTNQVIPDNLPEIYDKAARGKALNIADEYIESIMNQNISTPFKSVQSKLLGLKFYSKNLSYAHTIHLVYRDTKMYGTQIELYTLQPNQCINFLKDNETNIDIIHNNHVDYDLITLVKYKISDTVFEDKIVLVPGYDNKGLDNEVADYTFKQIIPDDIQVKLCDHYKQFKEDTGIDPDINKECS